MTIIHYLLVLPLAQIQLLFIQLKQLIIIVMTNGSVACSTTVTVIVDTPAVTVNNANFY